MNGIFSIETITGWRYEVESVTIDEKGDCYFHVPLPDGKTIAVNIHDCKPIPIGAIA